MKSEGWKYILLGVSLVMLFIAGILEIRPFLWLEASQYRMTGELAIGENTFFFKDDNALLINNSRAIEGKAISEMGKIYFNENGANAAVDQLGFLVGNIVTENGDIIKLDGKNVRIENKLLSGTFASSIGMIVFSGQTDWRPFDLAEVSVEQEQKLEVNKKVKIDTNIMATGGRKLYDVSMNWKSNNDDVQVDEYGYVTVFKPGEYNDVLTLSVAGEEIKVSLLATEVIKLRSDATKPPVEPNLVTQGGNKTITIFIEPQDRVGDVNSFAFIRGNDKISCAGFTTGTFGSVSSTCNFDDKGAGDWNLELTTKDGVYVFLSELRVVNPDDSLNIKVRTDVMKETSLGSGSYTNCVATGDTESSTTLYDVCNRVKYSFGVQEPSYLKDKKLTSGNIKMVFKIDGKNPCKLKANTFNLVGSNYNDTTKTFSTSVPINNGKIDENQFFYSFNYISTFYQGCDLAAEVSLENMNYEGLMLNAVTSVRVGIGYPKQVELSGDVVVEEGNIDIESTSEDATSYSMVAKDAIKLQTNGQNQITGYEINNDINFSEILAKLKENINKLIIERGKLDIQSTNIGSEISEFTLDDKSMYPEGRIIYDGNGVGDYILENKSGNPLSICGPVTLVVEGRDVIVNDDIEMANVSSGVGGCAQKGNFGLIVLDGDIRFSSDITHVDGYYFTTGSMYTGESDQQFVLRGVAVANSFVLQRY